MDDATLLSWIETGQNFAALLVAIGVAGEFLLGFMAGPARRRIDQAKDAEVLQVKQRAANLETGNIQLRTDLEKATAESKERQAELAIEQRKTAEAQQKAAEAQLALKKAVERAATPRRIIMGNRDGDQEVRQAKFKELGKYADTPAIIIFVQDEEAQILANDVRNALIKAEWKSVSLMNLATARLPLGLIEEGVQVRTLQRADGKDIIPAAPIPGTQPPQVVQAIIGLLNLDVGPPNGIPFGVRWEPDAIINGRPLGALLAYGFQYPDNGVVITVGRKPTEQLFWVLPDLPMKGK